MGAGCIRGLVTWENPTYDHGYITYAAPGLYTLTITNDMALWRYIGIHLGGGYGGNGHEYTGGAGSWRVFRNIAVLGGDVLSLSVAGPGSDYTTGNVTYPCPGGYSGGGNGGSSSMNNSSHGRNGSYGGGGGGGGSDVTIHSSSYSGRMYCTGGGGGGASWVKLNGDLIGIANGGGGSGSGGYGGGGQGGYGGRGGYNTSSPTGYDIDSKDYSIERAGCGGRGSFGDSSGRNGQKAWTSSAFGLGVNDLGSGEMIRGLDAYVQIQW